jgi:hypothetical protein
MGGVGVLYLLLLLDKPTNGEIDLGAEYMQGERMRRGCVGSIELCC